MQRQGASRADDEHGINIRHYALGEIGCGDSIHWDSHGAAQHAAKEGAYPFRTVIAP